MKSIDSYTNSELVTLSQHELDMLIEVEVMKAGHVLPDLPESPTKFKLEKTFPVWEICNGSDVICSLPSEELAQAVLAASRGEFLKESYIYEVGYEYKYMATFEKADIVKRYVYNEADLRANAKNLKTFATDKSAYDNQKRKYDEVFAKIQRIRENVMSAYWQAVQEKKGAEKIYNTFVKYKGLANGDVSIALDFLKNAFTEVEIESANSFLPKENQIPLVIVKAAE